MCAVRCASCAICDIVFNGSDVLRARSSIFCGSMIVWISLVADMIYGILSVPDMRMSQS